ncbi:hypothetical protein BDZ45DRAFT_677441 [Acephala macrosclerotiorum]|nr:hypothetical protein BDZ45DRAFT_677441 [Acephala macrosclerotiorum]
MAEGMVALVGPVDVGVVLLLVVVNTVRVVEVVKILVDDWVLKDALSVESDEEAFGDGKVVDVELAVDNTLVVEIGAMNLPLPGSYFVRS